jgi:hypothetical protein
VGTWRPNSIPSAPGYEAAITFNADKTFQLSITAPVSALGSNTAASAGSGSRTLTVSGKGSWNLDDKVLTTTVAGITVTGLSDATEQVLKTTLAKQTAGPLKQTIEWKSDDSFVSSAINNSPSMLGGGEQWFTRVKS